MESALVQQAEQLKDLIRTLNRKFRQYMLSQTVGCGLTVPQIHLMQELYQNPGITLGELSLRLGLAKSTVSGIVDRLEKQGKVVRKRNDNDRRVVHIDLSTGEKQLGENISLMRTNYLAGLMNSMNQEEIQGLIIGLIKINQLMIQETDGPGAADPDLD
ncbi:MarR family winged helix-turn-helix transcriptional regulator [Desulforamulus aeronauticus]|uniref:DNA-binding transcriptional regulator, MarR family n=1 Tax=Desulforamulus aeronauticus DSM 10349 TaxID=1121421 RepID=A0A1M6SNA6_9FIRM|nr:MarR family transcriptional regulator [Desulforamulus aeronauticus]SHK46116.1 DNA-binding transcriptional regulator, MarR family [Desulforamulus aeronauticus DSM 10349]